MLAYVVASLPLLLTLAGVAWDAVAVTSARRELADTARRAAWLLGMESVRGQMRARACEYFALSAPEVSHRVRIEDDRRVVVDLERLVPMRFLWVIGLPAIPVHATACRNALAAWEWRYPGDTWDRIVASARSHPDGAGRPDQPPA